MNYFKVAGVTLNYLTCKDLTKELRVLNPFEKQVLSEASFKPVSAGFLPTTSKTPVYNHSTFCRVSIPISKR